MPIPTRSTSLREPRQQFSSGLRRPTTRSGTTSLASGVSEANATAAATTANTNTNTNTTVGEGNALNRSKTLLPQRRSSVLVDGQNTSTSTTRLRFQEQRPRGHTTPSQVVLQKGQQQQQHQQHQQQQQQQPKESTLVNRRKSLVRPAELRIPSKSTVSTTGHAADLSSPSRLSPRKSQQQPDVGKKKDVASSPKKTPTDTMMMPPPPLPQARHGRSTSLKQPSVSSVSASSPASAMGHLRRHSQVVKGQVASKTGRPTGPTTPSSTASTASTASVAQRTRPQFTTFQQSFSPKKAVKPPTPTSDRAESGSSLISSSWPEVAALQTEVLQLSLLHSSYLQADVEWRANAEASLRKKYDSVAASYRSVLTEEKEIQRRVNSQALSLWLENTRDNRNLQGFPEQIQTLSSVVQDISDLSDSSGRYARVVCVFEDWFQKADRISRCRDRLDQQRGGGGMDGEETDFIDPLEASWKKELYGLATKLELCARELQSLDILGYGEMEMDEDRRRNHDDSALIRLVMGLGDMVTLMIEEVNAMRMIEDEIVRSERRWVSRRTEQLATTTVSSRRLTEDRVGIWKCRLD